MDLPGDLPPALAATLRARGIQQLYWHQAQAWQAAGAGRHLVVATPTASGKSLCDTLHRVDTMHQRSKTSYAVPALVYVLVIGATFFPDVQPVLTKAFGSNPFGLPVRLVVALAQAVLLLPFALAIHHFMRIAEQAARDGHGIGKVGLLAYAMTVGRRHPQLRRAQVFSLMGLLYFVALCGVWIAYAHTKGI